MLSAAPKILDTITNFVHGGVSRITGTYQGPYPQENEEDQILQDLLPIDLDGLSSPDRKKQTYWPPEAAAEIEDALPRQRSPSGVRALRPNYASGDSVSVVRRSGSAVMGKPKNIGRSFKPGNYLEASRGAFANGVPGYMSSRKPAELITGLSNAQSPLATSQATAAQDPEPPLKRRRTEASTQDKATHPTTELSFAIRSKEDTTSPFYNSARAAPTTATDDMRSKQSSNGHNIQTHSHKVKRSSDHPIKLDAKLGDGFDTSINVENQTLPSQDTTHGSGTTMPIRSKNERFRRSGAMTSNGLTSTSSLASTSRGPITIEDADQNNVKPVKGRDGLIAPSIVNVLTSTTQGRTYDSDETRETLTKQVAKASPARLSNTSRSRQKLAHSSVPIDVDSDLEDGGNHTAANRATSSATKAQTPTGPDQDAAIPIDKHDSDASADSNTGFNSSSRRRSLIESSTIQRQMKGSRKIGKLAAYRDVWGHAIDKGETYVTFIPQESRFQIHTQGSDESYYVDVANIRTYHTGGNEDDAVTALVQGNLMDVGKARRLAYWAAFYFDDNKGLVAMRQQLNIIKAGAPSSAKDTNKTEDWLQRSIKLKLSLLDNANGISDQTGKPGTVDISNSATSCQNERVQPTVPASRKKTKLRDRLQSGEADQGRGINQLDTDKHDEINYEEASVHEPAFRRSTRNPALSRAEPFEVANRLSAKEASTRIRKATLDPPKSRYPPFKDTPASKNPWPNSLVFPSTGPNRATVEFDDLHRLDDDQLLNDNLVQFGIKYAQELYPGLNGKIYVFNTYFYTSLTGGTSKSIAYDAVKRWTAKIDIFEFDHVVVPINQNTHWYMAIICNIKNILRDESLSIEDNDNAANQQTQTAEELPSQVNSLSISTDEATVPEDINQSDAAMPEEAPGQQKAVAKRSMKKKGQQGRLTDPNIPMIVTLDSLGSARSPVVGVLKAYLREEAKSKKNKVIPESFYLRQGMSAKGIPYQTNFIDCGIYVVYYLAKFFENPAQFMSKLLTKAFETEDWRDSTDPSSMRIGFREVILAKYIEQNPASVPDNEKQDAKKVLDTRKIFGGKGEAIEPLEGMVQARTGSATGKLQSRRSIGNTAVNKPFKSPVISRTPPQELAQASSMELAESDSEDGKPVRNPPVTQTPKKQVDQSTEETHVTDTLMNDLNDTDRPKSITRAAVSSEFKRTRSAAMREAPDELSMTPDNDHRLDFAQSPSRTSKIDATSVTGGINLVVESEDHAGESSSGEPSVPTPSVALVETTSGEGDSQGESARAFRPISSLTSRRRNDVYDEAMNETDPSDESESTPSGAPEHLSDAPLLSSRNRPLPTYQDSMAQDLRGTNRRERAKLRALSLQDQLQLAANGEDIVMLELNDTEGNGSDARPATDEQVERKHGRSERGYYQNGTEEEEAMVVDDDDDEGPDGIYDIPA